MDVKRDILEFSDSLEKEAGLISEAVADVVNISSLNDEMTARKLIAEQFIVINKQDLANDHL